MTDASVLQPPIALIALTLAMFLVMFRRRTLDLRRSGKLLNELPKTREISSSVWSERTNAASDNVANLLETPVLFYFLTGIFFITDTASVMVIILAWLYVAARAVHSLIHVSYNLISHRFAAFAMSLLILAAMTVIAIVKVFP